MQPTAVTRRKALVGVGALALTGRRARGWTHGVGTQSYTGLVATRGQVLTTFNNGFSYANSRSFHIARTSFDTLHVVLPAWASNNGEQSGLGGPIVWSASVSLDMGATWKQFLWSGASTKSVAAGTTSPLSDALSLGATVVPGDVILFGAWQDASAATTSGVLTGNTVNIYPAGGDVVEISASPLTNKTMGGTITQTNGIAPCFPLGLIGLTTQASVACPGDSKTVGISDVATASGDVGSTCRSIGAAFAYSMLGSSGENAFQFGNYFGGGTSAPLRLAFANAYCSHAIFGYGTNDIRTGNGSILTGSMGSLALCAGLFTPGKSFLITISPCTDSTDSYETTMNQTGMTNFTPLGSSVRESTNNYIIGTPSGFIAGFDVAAVEEPVRNDGFWMPGGASPNLWTGDGFHENQFASLAILASGAINTALFV